MKRHLAWWIVLTLLSIAWAPFGLDELLHKIGGLNYYPDEEVGLMFGVWLFVWWPCHITAALIVLYKLVQWSLTLRHSRKAS
jgi:hypothetical protein